MKTVHAFLLFLALSAFLSCQLTPKYLEKTWKPGNIVILPFTNESADVALEKFARAMMYRVLVERGYKTMDLVSVDAKLAELGITEGGHLSAITAEELGKNFSSDCFLYGNIIAAERVMLGVYFSKKVNIEYSIVNPAGVKVWEDERLSQEQRVVLNPSELIQTAAKEMLIAAGSDAIMKMLDSHPLIDHLRNVTYWSVSTLPKK